MGVAYFVTSPQCFIHWKQAQRERVFFFYRMPDSCIVFGDNNKSDSENGRALHIPFFLQSSPRVIEKKEKMDRLCNLSKFMLVSRANETLR